MDIFLVRKRMRSVFAGVRGSGGLSLQSGNNSSNAFVCITAPDKICAPKERSARILGQRGIEAGEMGNTDFAPFFKDENTDISIMFLS